MSNLAVKDLIEQAEKELLDLPQANVSVTYHFFPGGVIREIVMPAGNFAIGNRQKYEHLNVFLAGKVRMLNDDGTTTDLVAPMIFVGKPGRKAGMILEDVVWQNIYATDLTDIEEIESHFIEVSDYAQSVLDERIAKDSFLLENTSDYEKMLADIGYTQEMVDAECLNDSDLIPFPFGSYRVAVGKSPIHGKGLMVVGDIDEGYMIPANIGGKRTPAGRYTNHSGTPNAIPVMLNGDMYFQTIKPLAGKCGALSTNEITVDYRAVFNTARGKS